LAQTDARIVEDPHVEMLVRRNDVDGVHAILPPGQKETPISPRGKTFSGLAARAV
jgi:hypothetical protein